MYVEFQWDKTFDLPLAICIVYVDVPSSLPFHARRRQ